MRQIFIDKFIVPQDAMAEFTQRMNANRGFLRNLPGFIEDAAYERKDETGKIVILTIAVWESEEAIKNARQKVEAEYQRTGFRMTEMFQRLNITMERGIYHELVPAGA